MDVAAYRAISHDLSIFIDGQCCSRYQGEPLGMRVLRSIITPSCHKNARPEPQGPGREKPTTWPLLLMVWSRVLR